MLVLQLVSPVMLPNATLLVTPVVPIQIQLFTIPVVLVINNVQVVVKDGTLLIPMGQPLIKITGVMENVSHAL